VIGESHGGPIPNGTARPWSSIAIARAWIVTPSIVISSFTRDDDHPVWDPPPVTAFETDDVWC
jgi:hypothetical protein